MTAIKQLNDVPEYASILAFWAYREWYLKRAIPFDLVLKSYTDRIQNVVPPLTWIALEDDFPVGMVSLKNNELWSRKDLNPWLTSLYVLPEFRRKGTGRMLISRVARAAHEFGYDRLFLFTDSDNATLNDYYKRSGWNFLEISRGNDDNIVNIYCFLFDRYSIY